MQRTLCLGKPGALRILLAAVIGLWLHGNTALAATYTYDNNTGGTLAQQGNGACGGSTELQRTFNVTDNFTINDLNVGFNADHTRRGDVRLGWFRLPARRS